MERSYYQMTYYLALYVNKREHYMPWLTFIVTPQSTSEHKSRHHFPTHTYLTFESLDLYRVKPTKTMIIYFSFMADLKTLLFCISNISHAESIPLTHY